MIDIAIIGGGPAGLSAGLYAARGGRKTVLFEAMYAGGQITKTSMVENYPGFDEPVDGFAIASKMESQAARFGLEELYENVTELELDGDVKRIICGDKAYQAHTVILCTGASPRKLELPDEERLTGAGVSYCATCDGAFFRDKPVAVVGGGDTALSDALYLARFASRVYLVHRRDEYRAVDALRRAVENEALITPVLSCVPEAILGSDTVSGLTVRANKTGDLMQLDVNGIFVAIGVMPNTGLVAGKLALNENGYIITDSAMRTDIDGAFAAGDVRNTPLRQVVTAAADGAVAATSAIEYIMAR